MGFTSSRGKRPARLHSSIMGMRLSSMNLRAVSRTRHSSSESRLSNSMKSTPRNLMAGMTFDPQSQQDAARKPLRVTEGQRKGQRDPKPATLGQNRGSQRG